MINKQTTLDLNGPILSFIQQPQSANVDHNGSTTFVGIATASFPTQTPVNTATNTGTLRYRWYAEGHGALSDGSFRGATISGTGTTTLTVSNAVSPTTSRTNFYLTVDYEPSAYAQPAGSEVNQSTSRSTGNAINDVLNSNIATLLVYPYITITSQPESTTAAIGSNVSLSVDATLSDPSFGDLSYQWQYINSPAQDFGEGANQGPDSAFTVQGARRNALFLVSRAGGPTTTNLRAAVSNPNATTVFSNTISLSTINPRSIIIFEGFDPQNNYVRRQVNLENGASFQLTDSTFGPNFNIVTFYAPENDLDIDVEIRASKGNDNSGYSGGAGGYSRVRFTMRRNDEYTALGISNNSGVFLYRGSSLIAAVGKGGDAGTGGNGGAGGGVSNAGANGSGRNAGTGGSYVASGQLTTTGIFGSNSSVLAQNILPGDSKAAIPSGGRAISCTKGSYWTKQGKTPCEINGVTQFYNTTESLISRSAFINRGFKPGYTITATEGRATSVGGNGGNGAVGGSGGGEGGGGGGSGYIDSSITQLASTQGENNSQKSTINFKIYVPPPPPPPPPTYSYVSESSPVVSQSSCPDPDTLILMSDGSQKRAGDLKVGDYVRTKHESTLQWGDYPVLDVKIVEDDKVNLIFDETNLICSYSHKLYVDGQGWKRVSDMSIGDIVSGFVLKEIVEHERGEVVGIEIDRAHAYISNKLLSHNLVGKGSCPDPEMPILMADGSEKKAGDIKIGDEILTQHEHTLEWGTYKVIQKSILHEKKLRMIFASTEDNSHKEIICSDSHQFYSNDSGWISSLEMNIGDTVGNYKLISSEKIESGQVVQLAVDEAHTYVCCGLLSHNKLVAPVYQGVAGGVNQNAGFSQSQIYGGGTSAVLGASAVDRAVSGGYTLSSIQAWVNSTGATVGPAAQALGIRPARR